MAKSMRNAFFPVLAPAASRALVLFCRSCLCCGCAGLLFSVMVTDRREGRARGGPYCKTPKKKKINVDFSFVVEQ
ncbi:hypothetical protein BZA70DRAFT_271492 [Myxozyma melibiosi]|uniref:Secreted protein n=1 Tax=Myxozyma melibiosi TaxID=54550 RepID=A0ABR1FCN1_9ASCO